MASLRTSVVHSVFRTRSPLLRCQQRRWAQVHDVRFLATHHDPNHVLDKYKNKLSQKAQAEGHESIDSLKNAYKDKIQDLRLKASTDMTPETPAPSSAATATTTAPPPPSQPQAQAQSPKIPSSDGTGIKPLSSYLNVDKVRALPPKEIEALWRLRHANNGNSICACIPVETYQRLAAAARNNPQFILPLPRQPSEGQLPEGTAEAEAQTGADIHFLQWAFHPPAGAEHQPPVPGTLNTHTSTIIFTQLAAFKLHGSFAQPHTTITHHLDLADDKGLVLMHGQVVPDSGVSIAEASWLVSCVQRFYDFDGQASGRKGELVRMFTQGDVEGFKIEELMDEAERV
ncbi:hypothetical protein ASPZODRAFT_75209 [Penicilliopsis zonata CBS 506.65]|uniref:F1F0 ATP synthase assembly protein Atp11 n=1 Tax=Penicilliopsis zonata CBS 506.65 TaxID=1073090 RepID=A0A1L9S6Y0_9EURO|nr:hypothetical protein ASPZODRAFT_75209 [Penicilliopsis zonata CBS 506.65]OJJ42910.1 hypothetical protein ASPZODRAFT_75209 [Penicilliopsis zonata CBS 506.65]